MEQETKSPLRGCPTLIGWGCAVVAGIVVLGAALIWINWERVQETEMYDLALRGKAEYDHMMALRTRLMEEYPADDVSVLWNQVNDVASLTVTFTNPAFEIPESEGGEEALAREIALRAATWYPEPENFEHIGVAFAAKDGFVQRIDRSHRFPVADLVPRESEFPAVERSDAPDSDTPADDPVDAAVPEDFEESGETEQGGP